MQRARNDVSTRQSMCVYIYISFGKEPSNAREGEEKFGICQTSVDNNRHVRKEENFKLSFCISVTYSPTRLDWMIRQEKNVLIEKRKKERNQLFLFSPASSHNTFIYLSIERKHLTRFVSDGWSTLARTIGPSVLGWSRDRRCEFQCLENASPANAQSDESLQLQTNDVRRRSTYIERSSFDVHRSAATWNRRVSDECGSGASVDEEISTEETWSQFWSAESIGREGLSFRIAVGCAQSDSIEFGTDRSSEKHAEEDGRCRWPEQNQSSPWTHLGSLAIHADGKTTRISREWHHTSKSIVANQCCVCQNWSSFSWLHYFKIFSPKWMIWRTQTKPSNKRQISWNNSRVTWKICWTYWIKRKTIG